MAGLEAFLIVDKVYRDFFSFDVCVRDPISGVACQRLISAGHFPQVVQRLAQLPDTLLSGRLISQEALVPRLEGAIMGIKAARKEDQKAMRPLVENVFHRLD
jgi:hypothetical protein